MKTICKHSYTAILCATCNPMTPKPTGRGGPGRGQGAKRKPETKRKISVTISPKADDRGRAVAESRGVTVSSLVETAFLKLRP